jgi:hypothetical protein
LDEFSRDGGLIWQGKISVAIYTTAQRDIFELLGIPDIRFGSSLCCTERVFLLAFVVTEVLSFDCGILRGLDDALGGGNGNVPYDKDSPPWNQIFFLLALCL